MENKTWKVRVWGVRGGYPVPDKDFLGYGGNTSCISADTGEELVVFDGGSGLCAFGNELVKTAGKKNIHILISHLHFDHVMGLFGCRLFHDKEMVIHLYGQGREGESFRKQIEGLVGKPYWPLGIRDFRADIRIHEIKAGEVFSVSKDGDSLLVSTIEGRHPGGSLLYRLDGKEKCLVYGLDCEPDGECLSAMAKFAEGAGLMVWDANFAPGDERAGWGHSTWEQGLLFKEDAGIRKMLMTHFSWEYPDRFLEKQEELMRKKDPESRFAREGMVILL